jgi:hypothetical protein
MAGKFSAYTQSMSLDLEQLFNRSIRSAMRSAIEAAAKATQQDSSNAVVHWLVGFRGQGRSELGEFRNKRDLRGRRGVGKGLKGKRAPRLSVVGYSGDKRRGNSDAQQAIRFVTDRAMAVLRNGVVGRDRIDGFYLYNAVAMATGGSDTGVSYADNAKMDEAGRAGLERAYQVMTRTMMAGNIRKRFK